MFFEKKGFMLCYFNMLDLQSTFAKYIDKLYSQNIIAECMQNVRPVIWVRFVDTKYAFAFAHLYFVSRGGLASLF